MGLEIVQILASGTYGHVAVVRDDDSGDLLAAKVLKEAHAANPKLVSRLRDEAALLARLKHPNVVGRAELREIGGHPVLLMEWVRGVPLQAILGRHETGLDPANVCEIVRLTAAAMDAAWHKPDPATGEPIHLIHRDLKPSNLLMSVDGEIKIVDLGIAHGSFSGKESETVSVVLGAHGYLAPERLDGAEDEQSGDVFALGCIFFELLTGRKVALSLHPGHHAERMERHLMHLRPEGVSPRVVGHLAELVARMAAYEPADRPTYTEVVREIEQLLFTTGWRPNLAELAERDVVPLLLDRKFLSPRAHPAWESLAFLESNRRRRRKKGVPRESDETLRAFLASDRWFRRRPQLHRLLAIDPSWTSAPFVELLDRLRRQDRRGLLGWLLRRERDPFVAEQILAVLHILEARPDDAVRKRAWRLVGHRDPEISAIATGTVR